MSIQWSFRGKYGNTWERTDEEISVPADNQEAVEKKILDFIHEEMILLLNNEKVEVVSFKLITGPSFSPLFDGGEKPLNEKEIQDLYGFDCYWPACQRGGINLFSFKLGEYPACERCDHRPSCKKHAIDVDRIICREEGG